MADTDFDAGYPNSAPQAADLFLAMRGAGGVNFTIQQLAAQILALGNTGSGNVGIGIGSAIDKLNVSDGTATFQFKPLGGSSVGYMGMRTNHALALTTNDAERMRISAGGLVGIGTNNPLWRHHVLGAEVDLAGFISTSTNSGVLIGDSAAAVRLGTRSGNFIVDVGAERLRIETGGAVRPGADNNAFLGTAANRWAAVFSANGAIQTSDAREKLWLTISEDRRAKDRRIARAIFDELGWYQRLDSIEEKGEDGARWHFGPRAQRVWAIFAAEGLCAPLVGKGSNQRPDPEWNGPPPPALLCFDEWPEERSTEPVYSSKLVDEDGKPLQTDTREVVTRKAGNRFGLRVDQLGLLLDWALHDRLAALEAA